MAAAGIANSTPKHDLHSARTAARMSYKLTIKLNGKHPILDTNPLTNQLDISIGDYVVGITEI